MVLPQGKTNIQLVYKHGEPFFRSGSEYGSRIVINFGRHIFYDDYTTMSCIVSFVIDIKRNNSGWLTEVNTRELNVASLKKKVDYFLTQKPAVVKLSEKINEAIACSKPLWIDNCIYDCIDDLEIWSIECFIDIIPNYSV